MGKREEGRAREEEGRRERGGVVTWARDVTPARVR